MITMNCQPINSSQWFIEKRLVVAAKVAPETSWLMSELEVRQLKHEFESIYNEIFCESFTIKINGFTFDLFYL